jgi:uncharacterized protein (DUF488 family)
LSAARKALQNSEDPHVRAEVDVCADRFGESAGIMCMTRLFTIGHSTRPLEAFLELLRENGIRTLVDVRRFPVSRRHPHYNGRSLAESLEGAGIAYRHEVDLGGRRAVQSNSPNGAWRNAGFRGYADHMDTAEFRHALERVLADAAARPTAVLCAEAVPWRCHRNLIADAAVARGLDVLHIMGSQQVQAHSLHPSARRRPDGTLEYPEAKAQLELDGADGL